MASPSTDLPIPEVYSRSLLACTPGYALWIPSPFTSDPQDVRDNGVEIGDVGVITPEGEFMYFFNICRPDTHPRNRRRRLPDDFKPIPEGYVDCRAPHFQEGEDVKSKYNKSNAVNLGGLSVTLGASLTPGVKAEYSSSGAMGALLHFPWGADRANLRNLESFRELATRNAVAWYEVVCSELGRMDINGDLYLVTGHDKACLWAIAAHHSSSQQVSISLGLDVLHVTGGEQRYSYRWENQTAAHTRAGPGSVARDSRKNQSTVIRGFKIRLSDRLWLLRKGVSPQIIPVHDRNANPRQVFSSMRWLPRAFSKGLGSLFSRQRGTGGAPTQQNGNGSEKPSTSSSPGPLVEHVPYDEIFKNVKPYHPSDVLNQQLLLKYASADVAITHDLDWFLCLKEWRKDNPQGLPSDMDFFRSMTDLYNVVTGPTGCIHFDCGDSIALLKEIRGSHIQQTASNAPLLSKPQSSILGLLKSHEISVQIRALDILVESSKDGAFVDMVLQGIPTVITLLQQPHSGVQSRVVDTLTELSSNAAFVDTLKARLPDIVSLIEDISSGANESAQKLLNRFAGNTAFTEAVGNEIPTLVDFIDHRDYEVRICAMSTLTQVVDIIWNLDQEKPLPNALVIDQAITKLLGLVKGDGLLVRREAAKALNRLSKIDPLASMIASDMPLITNTLNDVAAPHSARWNWPHSLNTTAGSSSAPDC